MPGHPVQFVQAREGDAVQAGLVHGERTQLDQAHAELVSVPVATHPPQLDQADQHPMC
ncbi:hypothetical protein HYG77_33105 (plasmid) [Rhodococcus sp. ZPP]|uniref:hypothetical protein n=1 Tax=Rhodococcus sp. ZPP TaxID=2749906 RepID=UPI001AD89E4A|nr:hypothetical protein [Rhodococcus sp. ZPP]QTJ70388.1 hypothetical protein HYG77_33105 [Rhodococcus sp. ZPP]